MSNSKTNIFFYGWAFISKSMNRRRIRRSHTSGTAAGAVYTYTIMRTTTTRKQRLGKQKGASKSRGPTGNIVSFGPEKIVEKSSALLIIIIIIIPSFLLTRNAKKKHTETRNISHKRSAMNFLRL